MPAVFSPEGMAVKGLVANLYLYDARDEVGDFAFWCDCFVITLAVIASEKDLKQLWARVDMADKGLSPNAACRPAPSRAAE